MRETGWRAEMPFEEGLRATSDWYPNDPGWVTRVKSSEYRKYYQDNYAHR